MSNAMKLLKARTVTKRQLDSARAKRQQQDRRKESLFRKAYEYSVACEAEVYLGIRVKKNGQIFTFNSENTRKWLPTDGQMVGHLVCSPYKD